MKRKSKIIISITGIFLVVLILSGLTYAYFLTNIQGNTNTKSVSVTSANLQLTYNDGNGTITGNNIVPGTTLGEKTFSVTNTGNVSVSYGVYIEDVINEFERTSDITLTLTCESNKANTTCDGASTIFPENNRKIVTNDISSGETQTYRLVVEYIEAGVDQSVDMGKRLSGKVQIYGSERLTLEFNIANSRSGDYGIIESEPKTSYATIENGTGTYRFVGVPMGSHTLTIYDENDNIKGSSPIRVGTGNSTSVENTNITVPENTEEVIVPVNNISVGSIELGSVSLYEKNNPYKVGTLANAIIHNAMFVTDEEKALQYAEFRKTPITTPGTSRPSYRHNPLGTESNEITDIEISIERQEYYFTYSNSYNITDPYTGIYAPYYTLNNPSKCKFNKENCIRDLVNKGENVYIYSNNPDNFTSESDTLKTTTGQKKIYKIINVKEGVSENTINLVTHQIYNDPSTIENILSITEDDYGKSYYYRGDVTNNYVNFANMCWRIVRIEGDGSIKLILQDKNTVCNDKINNDINNDEIYYSAEYSIGEGNFGYEVYNGNIVENYLNPKSNVSHAQITLYESFQNEKFVSYLDKMKSGGWCYNNKAYTQLNGVDEILNKYAYYDNNITFYYRNNYLTSKCIGTTIDKYYDNTEMYVSALTYGEVAFAGAVYYPYTYYNDVKFYLKNTKFLLLSLEQFTNKKEVNNVLYNDGYVYGRDSYYNISTNQPLRPAIQLKNNISITGGNGSLEHPYEVE